jgi:hypothetical protein
MSSLLAIAATIFWGATGATIVAEQETGHVATVYCKNELTYGPSTDEGQIAINGLTVTVKVTHMPGDKPDIFDILVPEGYVAVPPSISVNEETTEEIRIFEIGGLPLG